MFNEELLIKEFNFKAIRSSGAGGQHVNKVSSKIELSFNIEDSLVFNQEQKERLLEKLKTKISNKGDLILQCGESRSQHKNKSIAVSRMVELLKAALKIDKERVPTKIPKSVIKRRLKNKRVNAEKKANRRKPDTN